jgi:hypothetical protein
MYLLGELNTACSNHFEKCVIVYSSIADGTDAAMTRLAAGCSYTAGTAATSCTLTLLWLLDTSEL